MAGSERPDILLLSLGTTLGWRVADALLLEQLERAGASTRALSVRLGATGLLRRRYPVNDAVEAIAARRALRAGLRRHRPRAVVISTTTAAMLADPGPVPYAVRLDAPAALNRPGCRNAPLHLLERRALRRARLVLPWSRAARAALPRAAARAVVVPPPVTSSLGAPRTAAAHPSATGPPDAPNEAAAPPRARLAVAYAPDVRGKGLDLVCAAWAAAGIADARLDVFGVDEATAARLLRRAGVPMPAATRFLGARPASEFRAALRRARVYVGGARWEDFGQAPLEALADGALLATVPSGGPFEALAFARELDPSLVAPSLDPRGLADAIRRAFELSDADLERYRGGAAELLEPYRPEAIERTVANEVLPALIAGT